MTAKDDQSTPQERTQYTGDSAAQTAEFKPGQIIGDNYRVLAWIGAGGMGNVYRVQHTIMHTVYALKTLSADKVTDKAWMRFQNEAQAIARMTHPNIVAIYNLGLHEGRLPYYVMELLDGPALSDILKTSGALDVEEALNIFIEVCTGMSFAHKKGIVHRDIKPANIVIVESSGPGSGRAKIVDFGIVKLTTDNDENRQKLTNLGEICGSPYYMSPEQCDGSKIDARSDIYSLGCTLFEALTGSPPYRGRNAMETMMMHQSAKPPTLSAATAGKAFSPRLEQAVNTLLAKAPMDRYQNMDLVVDELKAILKTGAGPTPRARKPVQHTSPLADEVVAKTQPGKVKPWLAAAAFLLIGALGFAAWQYEANQNQKEQSALTAIVTGTTGEPKGSLPASPVLPPRVIDKTAFVSVHGKGDKREIEFDFPSDILLGEILTGSPDKSPATKSIVCRGKQKITGQDLLYFFPSPDCISYPAYFAKFGPDLLHSITLPPLGLNSRPSVASAMDQITRIQGLKRLDLFNCEGASDAVLPLLDQSNQLEDLALDANHITVKNLIQCKAINKVKFLKYAYSGNTMARSIMEFHEEEEREERARRNGTLARGSRSDNGRGRHEHQETSVPDITKLLECLTKSPDLQVLEIPKFSLRSIDLQLIAKLKNLRVIDLSDSNLVSPNVTLLSDLDQLQVFHVDNCMIDRLALPAFKKLAAHSLKIISIKSTAMPAREVQLFREELPGVSVND